MDHDWHAGLEDVLAGIPDPATGKRSSFPIRHGTMRTGLYAPVGSDAQEPHDQDEIYIVLSGTGRFRRGAESVEFKPGDVLFVPARMDHRFEVFSDDFQTWVVFWGPAGGE
ncbi:MAG: cupin domain-containing protein [Alphaproteobacteria bacterium]|nr:cupin domain-containing protein [Alphaproteobacteria bacterium]